MRLESIYIKDVGCIGTLTLSNLHPLMNVLTGPNGVGKTTILKSICSILTNLRGTNLKHHAMKEEGSIEASLVEGDKISSHKQTIKSIDPSDNPYLAGFNLGKKIIYISDNREFNYTKLASVPRDSVKSDDQYTTLGINSINPMEIKGWFVNRYLFSAHEGSLSTSQSNNFKLACETFSSLDNTVRFDTVNAKSLDIMVKTPYGSTQLEFLSSGFKSLIVLILGIIKEIEFRFSDSHIDAKDFDGIIIIDEIDIHLHPTWQKRIIDTLLGVFPNAQFFVSTHSPHVVQSLQPNQLIPLEKKGGDIRRKDVPVSATGYVGWTIEEILTDAMGMEDTNTDVFQGHWKSFHVAIENDDGKEARRASEHLFEMLHPNSMLRKVINLQLSGIDDDKA